MKILKESTKSSRWHQWRDWLLISGVDWLKRPYTAVFKIKKKAWKISSRELMKYPDDSLGNALGIFLQHENFELMDKLENHDVFHVLLNIETSVKGEAIMQFVLIGNGKRSLFCLFTAILSWLLLPEFRKDLVNSYHRGKSMRTIHKWQFQYLLREPIELLQNMMYDHQENKNNKNIKPLCF